MSDLYLPPRLAQERRAKFEADVLAACAPDDDRAREWTIKLRRVDAQLRMVRARDIVPAGLPLQPGFYHVLRFNAGAPMSVFTLHNNGRYIEPNSRVFNRLAAGNLHHPDVWRELQDIPARAHAEAERERHRLNADRRDKLREVVLSGTRAQVSMDRTIPWTQNSQGRRPTP